MCIVTSLSAGERRPQNHRERSFFWTSFFFKKKQPRLQDHNSKLVLSPFLEVEKLDAIGKDKQEEEHESNVSSGNSSKEVVLISKDVLEEHFQRLALLPGYLNQLIQIAHLRYRKAIYGPGHWRAPVIPSPPYWD